MKKIDLFDFDGTLFRNPLDTPENRKFYEKETGLPWIITKELSRQLTAKTGKFVPMRSGWYGKGATLEPPLVPDPAPENMFIRKTCNQFFESKANPDSMTVIMTGRHAGIQGQVMRILNDGKLVTCDFKHDKQGIKYWKNIDPDVQLFFSGMDGPCPKDVGPKPNDTLAWKRWIIEQFYLTYTEVEHIEIWEDRDTHVEDFKTINLFPKITVNHVKDE